MKTIIINEKKSNRGEICKVKQGELHLINQHLINQWLLQRL